MNRTQLASMAPVMIMARFAGCVRPNHASGATLTSLLEGSQHKRQTIGTPMSQIPAPLAIIPVTSRPTKLVSTLPRNIRQAARRRVRRRSKTANSADFTTTATASTRIDPEMASGGTMTCINGTTGSHAKAGLATISGTANTKRRQPLAILVTFLPKVMFHGICLAINISQNDYRVASCSTLLVRKDVCSSTARFGMLDGTHQVPPVDLHQFTVLFSSGASSVCDPRGALRFAVAQYSKWSSN